MEWTEISPVEAAENKYYGLGGWLLFFYVLAVLAFVASFFNLMNVGMFQEVYGNGYVVIMGVSVVQGVLLLPFILLAPKKSPLMPKATISAYWLSISLTAIAAMIVGPLMLLPQLLIGVVIVLLFSWYLNRSKRVNVTYRHLVPVAADADSKTGGDGA
jgi:hypothetical protein